MMKHQRLQMAVMWLIHELTFEVVNQIVDNMVLVTEAEIELAIKDLIQRTKIVVEGAGALATAAILSGKVDDYVKGKKLFLSFQEGMLT